MPIGTDDRSVAVVTGGHAFDVPEFYDVFRSVPGVTFYPQDLRNFAADVGEALTGYDAVVFYTMYREGDLDRETVEGVETTLGEIGDRGTGIVVLHHAILALPGSDRWTAVCGLPDRGHDRIEPHFDRTVAVDIADPGHPVVADLDPWEMVDETYEMPDPTEENHTLLETDHPESMDTIGWTREFRNSRVFCFQPGHDARGYSNPQFRAVLDRGIRWTAGDL